MYGDLITANLYRMEKGGPCCGRKTITTPDGGQVEIPLDPLKTPSSAAAATIRTIPKPRPPRPCLHPPAGEKGPRRRPIWTARSGQRVPGGGTETWEEIRQELVETGYLRRRARQGPDEAARRKAAGLALHRRPADAPWDRNNLQNDRLTTKQAGKWDYWFHTQKDSRCPCDPLDRGAGSPTTRASGEAAALAAWFLPGAGGKKVPVDYTPVKYVKKPAGARPGMVVYTTYQTAYVDPDPRLGGHAAMHERRQIGWRLFVCYRFQCPRYPDCALAAGKGLLHRAGPGPAGGPGGRAPRRRSIPISALLRRILSMPGCAEVKNLSA